MTRGNVDTFLTEPESQRLWGCHRFHYLAGGLWKCGAKRKDPSSADYQSNCRPGLYLNQQMRHIFLHRAANARRHRQSPERKYWYQDHRARQWRFFGQFLDNPQNAQPEAGHGGGDAAIRR